LIPFGIKKNYYMVENQHLRPGSHKCYLLKNLTFVLAHRG